jgi:hypothetical protein
MIGLKVNKLPELLLKFGLSFMIFFFFLGAVIYLQNLVVFGNSMGEKSFVESESSDILVPGSLNGIWINLNRIGYQSFDTSGLPPLIEGYLFRGKAYFAKKLYSAIDLPIETEQFSNSKSNVLFSFLSRYPVSEDFVWFGFLAPLLLVIACTIEGYQAVRSREPVPIGLILVSIFFILCELVFRPGWDINIGRNFTLAVIPIVPFVSMFYKQNSKSRLFVSFIIVISLITMVNLLLYNPAKPMLGDNAIWSLSRNEKLALQNGWVLAPLNLVQEKIPERAVIGISGSFFEYPFFGKNFEHTLIPLFGKQLQDNSYLESKAVDFILLRHPNSSNRPEKQFWQRIGNIPDWALYRRATP